ncbi:cytochrome P450 6k1 [Nasonia vitripennis]|uniref:Cytochrome P450 n=1 Tax=Nasonia vitripennis TaxID=7425 RepID=A0A7M7G527_NASVI|nr:cytochrome P450 6k1 [Nasonia vitripennis]
MNFDLLSVLSYIVLLALSAFTLFYMYAKQKQTYWSKRGVYSPPCHWFYGHFRDAFLMKKSFPQAFGEMHNLVDSSIPVVGVYVMQKPFLLLRNPEVIKQVLIKDFNVFCNRYFAAQRKTDVIGSENLFSIKYAQWKYIRSKLSPAFSSGKLKRYFQLMLESAANTRNYLKSQIPDGEKVTIECRKLSNKYTTDVISSFSFGIKTNSYVEPEPEFYLRSRKIFQLGLVRTLQILTTFFFPKISDYLMGSMLGDSNDFFRNAFWESMNERKESGIKRGDIIDFLVELSNEKQSQEFKFEGDHLVAQSAILLVAGVETSAVTIGFTLLELAKHPEIQRRVREEIREKLCKDGQLAYEDVAVMTYLSQVISETLRLYPPAPLIDRLASEDYKLPGTDIVIEKGTAVYAALKAGLHEDPHYHPNPTKFDPDRFSEERKNEIQPCTYMPFGEGPRVCVGMRIGQLETMVGLITILSEYEVSLNPQHITELNVRALFLAPADGIKLYFQRIKTCQ